MKDVSNKIDTLRYAKATAIIKMKPESIAAIKDNSTPKKDVLATARAAGLLAVKNTASVIPHCHPIPIDSAKVNFENQNKKIIVTVEVKSIFKTGCEMEALHGVCIAALTVYDMLKPIDDKLAISEISLVSKKGGKSDFAGMIPPEIKAGVIVISDSVSKGKRIDSSGKLIIEKLKNYNIEVSNFKTVPDDKSEIQKTVKRMCSKKVSLIITTGGTGLSQRDITPEAIKPLIDKEANGIIEAARNFGQKRIPYAMLSRGIAGMIGDTLLITMPGSPNAVAEYFDALFPHVLHTLAVNAKGYRHKTNS